MKTIHEEAPEFANSPEKESIFRSFFISMLQSCLNYYFFWRRTCVVIISRLKLSITVKRLIPIFIVFP